LDNLRRKNQRLIGLVLAFSILFAGAGALVGWWSAERMRTEVVDQFNSQQLVLAREAAASVQRELHILDQELRLLSRRLSLCPASTEAWTPLVRQTFARVLEKGGRDLMILDPAGGGIKLFDPLTGWREDSGAEGPSPETHDLPPDQTWLGPIQTGPEGLVMVLGRRLEAPAGGFVLLRTNISSLLGPLLREIRSGQSGYAWLIDDQGTFLYHYQPDFVGQNAFSARSQAAPGQSFEMINQIQQSRMLAGQEGTAWYYSGWHRGITGRMKKLMAFTPVMVDNDPHRIWSLAVVAPYSEVSRAVNTGRLRLFALQGMIFAVTFLGAGTIIFLAVRWSGFLETEVRRRTEALALSEERYRSLVESAEDFIFTFDDRGRFLSVNSFTATFFGFRPNDLSGKELSAVFPAKVAAQALKLVSAILANGRSRRREFEFSWAGQSLWLSANFMPLKEEDGRARSVLCIARDVTEARALERRLLNAEKLASIGTLAAGVAHEINNPLGVILGFTDLIQRQLPPASPVQEDLLTIQRQGRHCKEIVENLLSFARTGGEVARSADLNASLDEIIRLVRHTLEMNQVELALELAPDLPPVRADSRQLQQVFLNLVTNASAAMPQGGRLTIRTSYDRREKKVVTQFRDTGQGIDETDLDRIYEPFFTTKPEGQGTGLGLFVSYGIISRFGGSIDCQSRTGRTGEEGPGTTFTVRLPAVRG